MSRFLFQKLSWGTFTQHLRKLYVCAGIFGDHFHGPFSLLENWTGEKYLELLWNFINPAFAATIGNRYNRQYIPDVPSRWDTTTLQITYSAIFPSDISKSMSWWKKGHWMAPRSSDLSLLDFFLWGHLKSKFYAC